MWAKQKQVGFTIVELLIVIVVIAILAAITIVAYNGIQNRARSAAVQSAANQAGKQALAYAPLNNDLYPEEGSFRTDLRLPDNTDVATYDYYVTPDRKSFCLSVSNLTTSPLTATAFTSSGQAVSGRCVMNIVTNPSFETNTNGWGFSASTSSRSATGAVSGSQGVTITPNSTGADSYASGSILTGTTSTLVVANEPYVASGTFSQAGAQSGALDSRARRLIGYSWVGSTPASFGAGTAVNNSAGSTRVFLPITVTQSGATRIDIRLYNGATNTATNQVSWDGVMMTKGTAQYSYGDGDSAGWAWMGTPHNSASFGPAVAL